MACSKEYNIAVSGPALPNPPTWSQLLWGQSTGVGNRSFGPNNAASGSFTGDCSSGPPPAYPNPANIQNSAALNSVTPWTGMARLAIFASRLNNNGAVTVNVQRNGTPVIAYALSGASQSINLDFSVAGGTQITVQVVLSAASGSSGGPFISASFSNLP